MTTMGSFHAVSGGFVLLVATVVLLPATHHTPFAYAAKCYFEQKQNWRIERTEADMSNSNKAQTMLTLELVDATPAPLIAIH
ncbi:hypothetical protein ALC60_01755 [Trachymyrmex zeteki]|uniref:Uncharacterized protein n=1 Tax=Mycetomoellerius zeteki TaxID=64791 RepID=A0A151XFW5_9HYME|nr:hypothetical protein ALC60_01755 [Trachymyrmex zeteki]